MDKKEIRRLLLAKRRSLSLSLKQKKEAVIHLKVLEIVKNYTHIGIYVSLNDEVETKSLIEILLNQGKMIYVPRCAGNTLTFHCIEKISD